MGGEGMISGRSQQRLCKRPAVKHVEELLFDASGSLSNVLSERYYPEQAVLAMQEDGLIDCVHKLEEVANKESEPMAELGEDLSTYMGKVASKSPIFARFANPPTSIQFAVEEMRRKGAAKRARRQRSWMAAFSFTGRTNKRPRFARFSNTSVGIVDAVQEMRQTLAAQRAENRALLAKSVIDISGLLSESVDSMLEEDFVLMTMDDDDYKSEADMDSIEVELGKDMSLQLGKDSLKQPKFGRFRYQSIDITSAVQEIRTTAIKKKESKRRSWAASFSFTNRSKRQPHFERFCTQVPNIQAAVQEMRQAVIAKKQTQHRSWAASFAFTRRSSKLPKFDRFSDRSVDISTAVMQMREAAIAKMEAKHRSWAASFSFTNRSSKKPLFERFAGRSNDIQAAVQERRRATLAKRASTQRSWTAAYTFTNRTYMKPKLARFAKPTINIQGAVEEMRCELKAKKYAKKLQIDDGLPVRQDVKGQASATSAATSDARNDTVKMLMAPLSTIIEHREHLQVLLKRFEEEVLKVQEEVDIAVLERCRILPESIRCPLSLGPVEPQVTTEPQEGSYTSLLSLEAETELPAGILEEVATRCERCVRALNTFSLEVKIFAQEEKRVAKSNLLIQDGQPKQEMQHMDVQNFIGQQLETNAKPAVTECKKLCTPAIPKLRTQMLRTRTQNTVKDWVAGSPASAARRMRKSTPSLFPTEKDVRIYEAAKGRDSSLAQVYDALGVSIYSPSNEDEDGRQAPYAEFARTGVESSKVTKLSAMSLDLGLGCTAPAANTHSRSKASLRAVSLGACPSNRTPMPPSVSLRPLKLSKSAASLPTSSSLHTRDSMQWTMGYDRLPFA